MAWQTSALFIQLECPADIPSLLHDLGVMEGGEAAGEVDFLTASTSMDFSQVCVGAADGWTIVCGMPVMLAKGQQGFSNAAKVVEMTLSGSSSTYQFAVYVDGEELRAFVEQEGNVIDSRGTPLPEEEDLDAFSYTEARVLEIVQRCTLALSAYENVSFRSFDGQPNFA